MVRLSPRDSPRTGGEFQAKNRRRVVGLLRAVVISGFVGNRNRVESSVRTMPSGEKAQSLPDMPIRLTE